MPLPLQQDFAPFHVLVADGDPSIRHACCAIAAGEIDPIYKSYKSRKAGSNESLIAF